MKHTMKNGTKIDIKDMSDSHLRNTITLIEKKAKAGVWVRSHTAFDDTPYEDVLHDAAALRILNHAAYVAELKSRTALQEAE